VRAGGLDRRVTLQRFTEEQDEYGEPIMVWMDLATVFAEVRQQGGREYLAAASTVAEKRVVFSIRWYPDLTVLDRVSYDGVLHNIAEVREIGRRDGVELHTVAAA
jgi:SPP1 family predicted phage head-tail adaptor